VKEEYKAIGSFATLGLEIVLSILFGAGAGWWADGKLGTSPALVLVGAGFGCAAAVRAVLRALREMKAVSLAEERAEGNPAPMFEKPDEPARPESDEARDANA
jgi:ATP synthase protein I